VNRGSAFKIPNEYGRFIKDILEPLDCSEYDWLFGDGQVLKTVDGHLIDEELFHSDESTICGSELIERINHISYYSIFADLKGFPKKRMMIKVDTYGDFLMSDCEIVLLITDSVYVSVYCKDENLLEHLHNNAIIKEYQAVEYITDGNDARTGMVAW
jgi:hypothetical protein